MNQLSQAQAFSSGAELWICPDYSYISNIDSNWCAQIDWQLNFALSKYHTHTPRETPTKLIEIIEATQVPIVSSPKKTSKHILVPCENLLPTKWCLFFNMNENALADLIKGIKKDLNIKTVRLFLPAQWSKDHLNIFADMADLQVIHS